MRSRLASFVAILVTVVGLHVIAAGRAHAQGAGSEPDPNAGAPAPPDPTTTTTPDASAPPATTSDSDADAQPSLTPGVVEAKEEARFGIGLRLRSVHIPRFLLELFVQKAATSVNGFGFGLEGYRRKGNFELQVGLEYEALDGSDGIWVDKGKTLTNDGIRGSLDAGGSVASVVSGLDRNHPIRSQRYRASAARARRALAATR